MKAAWHRFLAPLTPGVRVLLFVLAVTYVGAVTGIFSRSYNVYPWLGLNGWTFWHGCVWTIVTYALLPASLLDFLLNWVMVLFVGVYLERVWSRRQFWRHCLISTLGAGVAKVLLDPAGPMLMVGTTPIVFGLLAAWGWIFANERVLFWFIWDMTVRQVAIVLAIVCVLLMLPCAGVKTVAIMLCGGVAALASLWVQSRFVRSRASRSFVSERMGRLEL
jgi:membrane associated rhomboid family serine protease